MKTCHSELIMSATFPMNCQ